MAKFIKCSCENAEYRGYKQQNSPINLDLVTQVVKTRENHYPDNEGAPAIYFLGIDKKWVYATSQEKQRDADYEKIVNNEW